MKEEVSFKYHPNILRNDIVENNNGTCQCCGEEVDVYVTSMYSEQAVNCLCLDCIANGEAAKKFDGTFVQDADVISDEEKIKELFERTPGYSSWQGENWRACCNDYCAFIGDTDYDALKELDDFDDIVKEYEDSREMEKMEEQLEDGYLSVYLFKCLHCGKHKIETDCD